MNESEKNVLPASVPVYEHQVMYTAQSYAPPPVPFTPVVPPFQPGLYHGTLEGPYQEAQYIPGYQPNYQPSQMQYQPPVQQAPIPAPVPAYYMPPTQPQYQPPVYEAYSPYPVVQTETQHVQSFPVYVVTEQQQNKRRSDNNDFPCALICFILGFFLWLPWLIGCLFIKSRNSASKILGILSLFFAVVYVVVTATAMTMHSHNSNYYDF